MPRFVILEHRPGPQGPRPLHWDLMLEQASTLWTWVLERPPEVDAEQPALRIADHRLAYLDFEGPLSGDRGEVTRWDRGQAQWLLTSPQEVHLALRGARLNCRLSLTCRAETGDAQRWTARWESAPVAT